MTTGFALAPVTFPPNPLEDDDDSKVSLGSLMESQRGVWPAADNVNGPLLLDPGHTQTVPSLTGMRYVPWNTVGAFNLQAVNLVSHPGGTYFSAGEACQNVTTDRGNFGGPNIGFPSHTILPFIADTARLIIKYCVNTFVWGFSTTYHETAVFADLKGSFCGIREQPAVTVSGSGVGIYYREVSLKEARSKEFEIWMSSNTWFMGVYIDSDANIAAAPNRTLITGAGNSLSEPGGNVFSTFGGNGSIAGVGFTNASLLYSNVWNQFRLSTRFPVFNTNEGGTQWKNTNGGIDKDDATGKGFSSTWSTNQVNNIIAKVSDRFPILAAIGTYNDGDAPVAGSGTTLRDGYRDLVLYPLDKIINAFRVKATVAGKPPFKNVPIFLGGGEPKLATDGAPRDYINQGVKAAAAARPANVIGFFDWFRDWATSATTSDVTPKLGPDGLHPEVRGAEAMADDQAKKVSAFLVPQAWLNAMYAWKP